MKKEIDSRVVIGVIAVIILVVGFFAWRNFAGSPANGGPISAAQAGLGKPVYAHIPGSAPAPNPGAAPNAGTAR